MDPIYVILAALAVLVWIIIANISVVQQSRA